MSGLRKRDRETERRERRMPKPTQSPGALDAFREAQKRNQAARQVARDAATGSEDRGEVSS